MAKRAGLAILVCAVMVLVAAVPLVAGTTLITKGPKGPNASAMTWEYVPMDYGIWTGHIVNSGLRSLVVDVYDNSSGVPEEIMHQRIRFAAYDAYPAGEVDTNPVIMAAGHIYEIVGTPNGPQTTFCTVDDVFRPAMPPVAMFTHSENYLVVSVDGSGSYDPDAITPPGIVSWSWSWGDLTADGSGMTATHSYAMAGTYTITLTVTDIDGLTDTESQSVVVMEEPPTDDPPVARFTATMDWMVVSVDATTSSDDVGIIAWDWNFGDTTTGSGETATHEYLTPGIYTITLTVTDTILQTGTASQQVEAKMPVPPVASFTSSMSWMTVSVDGSGSSDADGTIASWAWNWGDMTTGSGATATHKYSVPGTYTITLTVTDNDGLTGTATDTVLAQQAPPVASFTSSVLKRDVSVDGSGSSDPDGTIATWAWNWGDGSGLGSGAMATHRYMSVGTFTITLTVTDNDGLTASSSQAVATSDSPPIASFTATVNGLVVDVDASGSSDDYPGLTYAWSWGDGTTGSGMTATHTYAATPPAPPAVAPSADGKAPPPPPFLVFGQTFDKVAGVILPECTVMITNLRTGSVNYTTSDALYGYYEFNLNDQTGGVLDGDMIKVTATKGTMTGETTGQAVSATGFVYLDVVLTGGVIPPQPYDVTITLTVTDVLGQTATMSKVVTVTPPAA